jgi:hypothetical protein
MLEYLSEQIRKANSEQLRQIDERLQPRLILMSIVYQTLAPYNPRHSSRVPANYLA